MSTMWVTEPNLSDAQLRTIKPPVWVVDGDNEEFIKPEHAAHIGFECIRIPCWKRFGHESKLRRIGLRLKRGAAIMGRSRREFLKTAAVAATTFASVTPAVAASSVVAPDVTADQIIALFDNLPGDVALKILAPSPESGHDFVAELNSGQRLFAASAIKTYVLCEALRQADSSDIDATLEQRDVVLDSTIWSLGSPIFNPPNVTGVVSERTTLEAMITRSDNTATDMAFKLAGVDNVRAFIASAGLENTLVPDSTRALTGYLFGAENYLNLTWEELLEVIQQPQVHPFLNDVQTLASSADDFVSYYSRALRGEFFEHIETLNEFRRILTLCDFIYLVPLPLGASVYAKSGNADTPGFHARTIAGGMFVSGRWAYFAFMINWYTASPDDPDTVNQLYSAINQALTLVKDSLSRVPLARRESDAWPCAWRGFARF
jgi:beta-lactamase class A